MPPDYFLQFCVKPMVQMRLFHYPPQAPVTDDKAFGVALHSDYGMITLLSQDPIGGLELRKRDGGWIGAPFIPGTLDDQHRRSVPALDQRRLPIEPASRSQPHR